MRARLSVFYYLYALLKHLLSHARTKGASEYGKNGVFLRQRKMESICSKVQVASGEFDPRNSKVKICCHELLNSKCHTNGPIGRATPRLQGKFFVHKMVILFYDFFLPCRKMARI
jgi:hypothetical protein